MSNASILGVHPNVLLLFTALWVLQRGHGEGLLVALVGGVILDVSSAAPFGMTIALLGAGSSLAALGRVNVFRGAWYLKFLVVAGATILYNVLSVAVLRGAGFQAPLWPALGRIVLPEVFVHMLLTPIVYALVRVLCLRLEPATVEI